MFLTFFKKFLNKTEGQNQVRKTIVALKMGRTEYCLQLGTAEPSHLATHLNQLFQLHYGATRHPTCLKPLRFSVCHTDRLWNDSGASHKPISKSFQNQCYAKKINSHSPLTVNTTVRTVYTLHRLYALPTWHETTNGHPSTPEVCGKAFLNLVHENPMPHSQSNRTTSIRLASHRLLGVQQGVKDAPTPICTVSSTIETIAMNGQNLTTQNSVSSSPLSPTTDTQGRHKQTQYYKMLGWNSQMNRSLTTIHSQSHRFSLHIIQVHNPVSFIKHTKIKSRVLNIWLETHVSPYDNTITAQLSKTTSVIILVW